MSVPLRTPGAQTRIDADRLARLRLGVWRFVRFLGAGASDADDLTQEVFVRLWSRPFEDRGDAALFSWLRRTAHNLYRSSARELRHEIATLSGDELEQAWERMTRRDPSADLHMQMLDRCLEELDERSRLALTLRHGEDAHREQIAARLGVSVEGVKSLLRRAKERVRVCIRRRLEEHDGN